MFAEGGLQIHISFTGNELTTDYNERIKNITSIRLIKIHFDNLILLKWNFINPECMPAFL